ncbi:FecR domain-containing protein [Sphingobacterium sp. SRCM116780]|uniref:FecR family protein n=1 Tax=Sphingobacterium sp. SRCM116780 TaxID=2907623 RepID=UPI001F2DAB50|nr:FecR family protein [Sphingobacterium sp. SRCM116780]UIR57821.1 FecR domain-containing protein [Sphingobacterium sp. SRCM116780]
MFKGLEIVPLLKKYIRGLELSIAEKEAVEEWIAESDSNRATFQYLTDDYLLAFDLLEFEESNSTTEQQLEKFNKLVEDPKPSRIWLHLVSAAAVLFIISISVWIYRYYQSNKIIDSEVVIGNLSEDILPGTDKAALTFEDGKVIELIGDKKTIKVDDQGTSYLDGTSISTNKVQYATLTTPRQGQYKVTLPDGTKVWLNAESSLKYPTKFSSAKRYVELKGEGYFEVAHDRTKPFIVASNGQQVKVLGTKFNINSYDNEASLLTTLVSGSVELSSLQSKEFVKLKPGEQANLVNDGFDIKSVDTEPFTAWTKNEFQFNGANLQEVLRQLERWYDIHVDYSHIPKDIVVYATISRDKKLSTVLYSLEKISSLKFQLNKGRRLEINE